MSGRSSSSLGELRELAVLERELGGRVELDPSASPSERWVNVENQRIDSISSPNSSSRAARSSVAGKTSRIPPRTAN